MLSQTTNDTTGFIINRCVKTKLLFDPAAFVFAACDPYNAAPFYFSYLPDKRTYSARSSRHDKRFTGFWLPYFKKTVIGCQPDMAKETEKGCERNRRIHR